MTMNEVISLSLLQVTSVSCNSEQEAKGGGRQYGAESRKLFAIRFSSRFWLLHHPKQANVHPETPDGTPRFPVLIYLCQIFRREK
jgi:hypothetical protein